LLSHQQNAEQNHDVKTANRSYENGGKVQIRRNDSNKSKFGREKIKSILNSGNPFSSEPSVFSSAVQKLKIKIYKTTILPVVLYGRETWSLTLGKDYRLKVGILELRAEENIWTKEG
jgi:hypothetical protein